MLIHLAALVAAAALQTPPAAPQPLVDSTKERLIFRHQIMRMFETGQIDALEQRAKQLRATRPRFSSGLPMLYDFYKAFDPQSEHVTPPTRESYAGRLLEWAERTPNSFVAKMAAIKVAKYRAWKARGEGSASSVSAEGWKVFRDEHQKAWSVAQAAERLGVSDPALYEEMIYSCRDQDRPWADVDAILRKLIAIDPTFDQAYVAVANYLLPRWHGSPAELGQFARRAMEESGPGMGPVAYVRVVIVPALTERGKIVREYPFDYKIIKAGFQDLDRRYPNSGRTINFYAWFSLTYGDVATARPLIDRIAREWTLDADEVWGGRAFFTGFKRP